MTKREKIALYLSQNLAPSAVASMVGCTPAYISQLWKEESFKAQVAALQAEGAGQGEEEQILANRYIAAKHKAITAIETALPGSSIRDASAALRAITEAENLEHKRKVLPTPQTGNTTIVQIALPQIAVPLLQLTKEGEVISINGRPMAPLATSVVKELFGAPKQELLPNEESEAEMIELLPQTKQFEAPELTEPAPVEEITKEKLSEKQKALAAIFSKIPSPQENAHGN